jgi:hypothetical protein
LVKLCIQKKLAGEEGSSKLIAFSGFPSLSLPLCDPLWVFTLLASFPVGWVLCLIKLARVSSKKPWWVPISVGQLGERITTDHQRVSGWSLRFRIMTLQKSKTPFWFITTVLNKLKNKTNNQPEKKNCFFHENHKF